MASTAAVVVVSVLIVFATLAGASPAVAEPCHDLARDALVAGILGQKSAPDSLRRCLSPIDKRPPGSENWPVVGRVGLVLQGGASADDATAQLLPFLRGESDWGLNGGEGKSEIYGAWNPVAMLAWWNLRLRDAEPSAARQAVRRFLRAVWTMHALGLYARSPEVVIAVTGGSEKRRAAGRTNYRGPVLHHPGMRSALSDAHWLEASPLNGLVAAALGLAWQSTRPIEKLAPDRAYRSWPQAVAQHVVGDLHAATPAEAWGLTAEERQLLARFVENPNLDDAEALLPWLDGYRTLPGVETVWIRFDGEAGGLVSYQTRSTNHVKSGQGPWMIAAAAGAQAWRLAPLPLQRADDLPCTVDELLEDEAGSRTLIASSKAGELRFPLPRFGRELFRVVQAPSGFRVTRPAPSAPALSVPAPSAPAP